MSEAKPIASLTPTLLARKGGARPAMRSQMTAAAMAQLEDLGWNDMGHNDGAYQGGAEIVHLTPEHAELPEVLRQRNAASRRIACERRSALSVGRRAAFTLRVDAERHLKLRLACALSNRSAQRLVTDALDHWLDSLPDVTELAEQVAKKRN